jgi:hypothetical protein
VLKNLHKAVSQGARHFGKRSLFGHMQVFTKYAQRRITARSAAFQHPVDFSGIRHAGPAFAIRPGLERE